MARKPADTGGNLFVPRHIDQYILVGRINYTGYVPNFIYNKRPDVSIICQCNGRVSSGFVSDCLTFYATLIGAPPDTALETPAYTSYIYAALFLFGEPNAANKTGDRLKLG